MSKDRSKSQLATMCSQLPKTQSLAIVSLPNRWQYLTVALPRLMMP